MLIQLLLIGLASNLDNLGVGLAYGARRIQISALANLTMAAIAFLLTWLATLSGQLLQQFISEPLANLLGAVLLIGVGLWLIWGRAGDGKGLLGLLQRPEQADRDGSGSISLGEALILGVALAMNCVTNGFAAGLWELHPLGVAGFSALFSFLSVWGGCLIGRRVVAGWLGQQGTLVAGLLLIGLGLFQLV